MPSPMDAYQPKNNLKDLQATIIEEIDELSTTALRLSRNKQLVSFVEETFHKKRKQKQKKARLLALSGIGLWFVAIVVFAVSIMPQVAYGLFPDATERVAAAIGATVDVEKSGFGDTLYKLDVEAKPQYVPPFDPSLPKKNNLIIPEIGL